MNSTEQMVPVKYWRVEAWSLEGKKSKTKSDIYYSKEAAVEEAERRALRQPGYCYVIMEAVDRFSVKKPAVQSLPFVEEES